MNNVLLTGSSGFLGNYIYKSIKAECNLYTLNRKFGDYICDLSLDIPLYRNNFDIIIHCAGLAHVETKDKNEQFMIYNNNLNTTKNLLKSLLHKPKIIIFISSVSVYGLYAGEYISEEFPLLAKDSYGLSKIHSEDYIMNWCQKNNVKYLILRLPILVGDNPKGNLKKMINAIKYNYYFEIENGEARKSMLLASDVANNIIKMSHYEGIYNLTDRYHPSFHEIASIYSKLLKKKIAFSFKSNQARYLAKIGDNLGSNFIYNTDKFQKIISNLTFDDNLAYNTFQWKPNLVLNNITL